MIRYQTPGRYTGADGSWLDKGFFCQLGARQAGAKCVWQKVVLYQDSVGRKRGGTRGGFINLLCFSKRHRVPREHKAVDVLADRGHMSYGHAMGEAACRVAIEYCMELPRPSGGREAAAVPIVDFFCGHGSVLGVANAFGLPAYGMDISLRCCETAAAHRARLADAIPKHE
mmetsp:Transcript_37935/g.100306  ORF Transcript_37935/g.100306 Transcript_37935/m.100306 type:complete len:171 (+) Transcript_37935:671-1183(+)